MHPRQNPGYANDFQNHCEFCDIIGQQSNRIRWKKRKIRGIMPFKVIQSSSSVSIESQYVTYFLIVIDSNRYPISYRFGVIAAFIVQILDTVITFEPPPLWRGAG